MQAVELDVYVVPLPRAKAGKKDGDYQPPSRAQQEAEENQDEEAVAGEAEE